MYASLVLNESNIVILCKLEKYIFIFFTSTGQWMAFSSIFSLVSEIQAKAESYDLIVGENAYLKQRLETVITGKCC